jgi:hypothetical protein
MFGPNIYFLLIILGVPILAVTQILDLVRRPDSDFSGRHDKLIWALAIVGIPIIGPLAYLSCKPVSTQSPDSLRRDFEKMQAQHVPPPDEPGKVS